MTVESISKKRPVLSRKSVQNAPSPTQITRTETKSLPNQGKPLTLENLEAAVKAMANQPIREAISELLEVIRGRQPGIDSGKAKKLSRKFARELSLYFRQLGRNLPFRDLPGYLKRNAVIKEKMSPADWKAEYQKGIPHWAEELKPSGFAKDFIQLMNAHKMKTVLEVGCGNGRDSIAFAQAGFKVSSIDIVPKAVKLARANIKKSNVKVNIQVASVEKLPFDDESFGGIYTLSVLHSTNLKKSLPEVARVLQPKGVAFIYIYGNTQFKDGKKTEDTISFDSYLRTLKSLGFKVFSSSKTQEPDYDEFGEKHNIYVVTLQKEKNEE
ncbi:hypothetical protein LCGC14_2816870 [marine sediment metagenome]|uniref:Methyltransferase type 11 domain-containing protein n=1 Tax=marine sediment metagenome TaxID=412755 RepID=A0A0F8Z511_9ZZZZ